MAREICINLFVQEIIDKAMGIDRDVNAVNTVGRTREIIQLSGCDGHRRKDFLFNKRRCWLHRRNGLGG